jgi:superoxide dismutase
MAGKKSPTKTILDVASRFVKDQGGKWNHEEWEQALKQVEEVGVAAEEEVKRHFGNLLEATKYFYELETAKEDGGAAATPRSAKPRAKVKAKAKAKAKPRGKPRAE